MITRQPTIEYFEGVWLLSGATKVDWTLPFTTTGPHGAAFRQLDQSSLAISTWTTTNVTASVLQLQLSFDSLKIPVTSVQVPTSVVLPSVSLHAGLPSIFKASHKEIVANTWTAHSQALDNPPYFGQHTRLLILHNSFCLHDWHSNSSLETVEFLLPSVSSAQTSSTVKSTQVSPKCVEVQIEGVPVRGIIDTGLDFSILNGSVCWEITATCGLKKEQFKSANQKACTYGHHPTGQINLEIKLCEKSMSETVLW